jgi:hypothetical protein
VFNPVARPPLTELSPFVMLNPLIMLSPFVDASRPLSPSPDSVVSPGAAHPNALAAMAKAKKALRWFITAAT